MSDDIDLTPDAVERLAKRVSPILEETRTVTLFDSTAGEAAGTLRALSARLAALETAKWNVQRADTMNAIVQIGMARDQAEARAKDLEAQLAQAVEALRPFARATITPTGEIVGMERVFFEQARATLAQIGEGHD